MSRRIVNHPVLGDLPEADMITFYVNGTPVYAREGETIAAALTARGIIPLRVTEGYKAWRGLFCAIGRCTDCAMTVDGVPNVRTCITTVKEGMRVQTQQGLGTWEKI